MSEYKEENKRLQTKVYSLSHANDVLQRKLFEYDEMHNRLVTSLGFSDVSEAMDSIIAESQSNSDASRDFRERIRQLEGALTTQLDAVKAADNTIHSIDAELRQTRQELSEAMEDIERLRHERDCARQEAEKYATEGDIWRVELETKLPEMQNLLRTMKQNYSEETFDISKDTRTPETNISDTSESIVSLRNQLEQLKIQYQALLSSKNRIMEKYQGDLVKWKRFKEWTVKGKSVNGGTNKHQKLIIRRKRLNSETAHGNEAHVYNPFAIDEKLQEGQDPAVVSGGSVVSHLGRNLEESLTQPSDFPSSQTIHGILPSPVSTKKRFPPPSSPLSSSNAHQTDTNPSSGSDPSPALSTKEHSHSNNQPTSPLNRLYRSSSDYADGKLPQAGVLRGTSTLNRSVSSSVLELDASPSKKMRNAAFAPKSSKEVQILVSDSEEDSPIMASKTKPSTNTPANKTLDQVRGKLTDYIQFKGRGRYSNANETRATINNAFNVNPNYHTIDEHTRNRDERKMLKGGDCECCREYYNVLRPLPKGLVPPLWRSPSTERTLPPKKCLHHSKEKPSEDNIEAHKNEISRHRHHADPALTPPNFWKIGFPNTQEVVDINRRADDMHAQKYQRVEGDSKRKDGKYRRKA